MLKNLWFSTFLASVLRTVICLMDQKIFPFSALTLLVGQQKGIRPVKTEWWGTGVIVCSKVQMICIWSSWCHCPLFISYSSKIQNCLPFWCWLTQVVLEKRPLNVCSVVVVDQKIFVRIFHFFVSQKNHSSPLSLSSTLMSLWFLMMQMQIGNV